MNSVAKQDSPLERAVRLAEERFIAANPLSRARHERACKVLPAGHSRQTLYYPPFPLVMERGDGARITDLDGHEYLNLVGDYAAGVFGSTCAPLQKAVMDALHAGISLSALNIRELELAELISRRMPSMEQVRFCNSGSEACLFATMLARHATRRQKLLIFNGCYHGGFMIYGENDPPLSMPFAVVKATYNDVDGTRAILRANGMDLAAVLVEPMMGAGGCIPATPAFLAMLREETRRAGALLIFDEVMTSRLGPGGVQGLRGIQPDLTTLGKFWGGGFAFGAFGGSREVMRHLDVRSGGALSQSGTFNNNIVTMSAGLVGARDVYTPEACLRLNALGDSLRDQINALARQQGIGLQATGIGAVFNLHWQSGAISEPGQVEAMGTPRRRLFQLEMIERGYYVAQRGLVTLSLAVRESDLAGFMSAVRDYLSRHAVLLPASGTA